MVNNKILMTGATGFLGSNLLRSLLGNGYDVAVLKRSTSNIFRLHDVKDQITFFDLDNTSIEDCLESIKPGIIIHCATDYGRKQVEPSGIIEANLILPLKLLELCRKFDVACFINTDTFLDKGINYYSLSKKQFKEWLDTYAANLVCVNMVLEHFYGPFDDKTKFVSFIIEKFLSNAVEIDLTLGNQKRDFIFIDDVVAAFICVIKNIPHMPKGAYNYGIGTNEQVEIRALVEMTKNTIGNKITNLNFGAIPYRKNETMESNIDTSAIRSLNWTAKYSLKEGLQKTIEAEKIKNKG